MSDVKNERVRIAKSAFGRYIIVKAEEWGVGGSGSRWDRIDNRGFPAGQFQISNFDTPEEAEQNAKSFDFEVLYDILERKDT